MRILGLTVLALAWTIAGCGQGDTPEQRLRNAGFTAHGAPNFLSLFGSQRIEHGVLLRKGDLTVAVIEFEKRPPKGIEAVDQVVVGKTLVALVGADPSDELQREFADAVQIARG